MNFILNKHSPQARGLVGWWPFINYGGGLPRDLSGAGNHFTSVTQTIGSATTNFGTKSANFVAHTDQRFNLTTGFSLSTWPLSLVIWAERTSSIESEAKLLTVMIGFNDRCCIEFGGTTAFGQRRVGGVKLNTSKPTVTADGRQHHWVMIADDSLTRFYLDNVKATDETTTETSPSFTGIFMGRQDGGSSNTVGAEILEARLYNRALSDRDVAHLYNPATRWELYQPLDSAIHVRAPIPGSPQFKQSSFRIRNDDGNIIAP